MKGRLQHNLTNQKGFVLIFAMMMILLLLVFMTAMVGAVSYTNNATAEKSEEHQLHLTAQSATGTLKEMFATEENMVKLSALAASGAEQVYDLSSAGITNKVKARVTDSGQPGYALLTVTAFNEEGEEYTTTALLPMMANQGNKNDLIENMIVSYWPNSGQGFTQELTYDNNTMNGAIIIDNEYYAGSYKDGKDKYKDDPMNDPSAVRVKGGTFKELVTTGNLILNAEQEIKGTGNTTIASAVGQLVVTKGAIGEGIKELGAGGYFKNKGSSTTKTGNMLIGTTGDVEFKGAMDIITRDKVSVTMNKVSGNLKNCFIGGELNCTSSRDKNLNVEQDLQVYKSASYNLEGSSQLNVQGDIATGVDFSANLKDNSKLNVNDAIVTATGDIDITGGGETIASYILSGKGINATNKTTLTDNKGKGYGAFSGGNYGVSNKYYETDEDDRGETKLTNVSSNVSVVVNNAEDAMDDKLTILTKSDSAEGLSAFKAMNSLWLTKSQKVFKGGWWNSCEDVKFAVALLFDNTMPSEYLSYSTNSEFKRDYSFINSKSLRYDPKGENDEEDRKKNWQWYEMKNEKYHGNEKVPVSHELGYTTEDSVFLLRSTLQKALGGPTDSTNLNINATSQGRFVDTARTAIPFDGAIEEIQVNYPHYANYGTAPTVDQAEAGWASIQEYKDGYLIGGASSTTGYKNFGRIEFRNDGLKLFDGVTEYPLEGKTLYFKAESPNMPGGWGDFYLTSDNSEIKLNSKIVIEYQLNGTDAENLTKLGFVRFFLDPSKKLICNSGVSVEGINLGSVDVNNVDFEYNNFHYTEIMPEFYIFVPKPAENAKESIELKTKDMDAFIIAPWSVVYTREVNYDKATEVFKGIILCKNFVRADGGAYNHYKPVSFGFAMSDAVFVIPEKEAE